MHAKSLLGMEAAKEFVSRIGDGKTVAVTGGSTIASIPSYIEKSNDLKIIVYRGTGWRWGRYWTTSKCDRSFFCGGMRGNI